MSKKKSSAMETRTLTTVPSEERKPWWNIALIWAGIVICIPALMVGSMISVGLTFGKAVLCMIIGYVIVVFYMCLLGIQSCDLGLPCTVSLSRVLGVRGSQFLASLIIAVSNIGWFGAQTAVCANSFCSIMNSYFGVSFPFWISCIIWGGLMLITAVYGVKLITVLNKISIPALFIMLAWGVIVALMKGAAGAVANYHPEQELSMTYGITMAVAGYAVGAVMCGDYTRYSKSRKETVISCLLGVLPAGIGVLVIGSFLAIWAGNYDLSIIFSQFGLPIIGLLVLILATWTTNTGNAYSSGIALCNFLKLRDNLRSVVTLICGTVGTALALIGIIDSMSGFLNAIAVLVPPIAGVAIADYWIMGKGRPNLWKEKEGFNWIGIAAWMSGAAVANWTTMFVPTLNGIIFSIVVYCIGATVIKSEKINPIYQMRKSSDVKNNA